LRYNASERNGAQYLPRIYTASSDQLAVRDRCVRYLHATHVLPALDYNKHGQITATIVDYVPVCKNEIFVPVVISFCFV
jgi:hypothetical protein